MDYVIPSWMLYIFVFLFLGSWVFTAWIYINQWLKQNTDKVIFIDETERWSIKNAKLDGDKYTDGNRVYYLSAKAGLLSNKGKKLFIFSKNKPQPMKIGYNIAKWLDSEALSSTIKNDLIKQMLQPSNKALDQLMLFGSIGGIIAAIASLVVLAKSVGVI